MKPWTPLRESLGDEVVDAAIAEAAHDPDPYSELRKQGFTEEDLHATWLDSIWPETAENYRQLSGDPRATEVFSTLKRRGATDWEIEILLRNIALLPRDWRSENEPLKQAQARCARLARKLHRLAKEVASDPDLSGFRLGAGGIYLNAPPEDRDGLISLADFMNQGASCLELPDPQGYVLTATGKIATTEFVPALYPERKVSLKTFVLRAIFDRLEPYFSRAPNKETAILASVLLRAPIKPSAVTQLRKKVRRRHYRG